MENQGLGPCNKNRRTAFPGSFRRSSCWDPMYFAKLFSGMFFCFVGFGALNILLVRPTSICFFPQGSLNSLVGICLFSFK